MGAEAAVADAKSAAETKNAAFEATAKVVETAKLALIEAEKARDDFETALTRAQETKASIESAMATDLKAVNEELQAGAAKKHIDVILSLAGGAGLESSLITSLPSACSKAPATRGQFDNMVMDQLEKSFNAKVVELTSKLAAGATDSAANCAKVDAAQSALNDAESAKQAAHDESRCANDRVRESEIALAAARDMAADFEPNLKEAVDACGARTADLESFVNYELACFTTLRDKASKAVEKSVDTEV